MKTAADKGEFKIQVSHSNPEIQKHGVETVINIVEGLAKIFNEKVEIKTKKLTPSPQREVKDET